MYAPDKMMLSYLLSLVGSLLNYRSHNISNHPFSIFIIIELFIEFCRLLNIVPVTNKSMIYFSSQTRRRTVCHWLIVLRR
uniref:Uncharacterized protein n=1 Tax=Setaria italica TaxID=4555 RepID=K4A3J6_SETIT